MMKLSFTALFVLAACGSGSVPPKVVAPPVASQPRSLETFEPDAPEALVRACRAAPVLQSPQPWKDGVLTRARPLLVFRYVVPDRDLDWTKGEGEIGIQGASRPFDVQIVEMQTNKIAWTQGMGRCFENAVHAPRRGELCAALRYDDAPSGRPLDFRYDVASRMHYQATESAYEGGSAEFLCPKH